MLNMHFCFYKVILEWIQFNFNLSFSFKDLLCIQCPACIYACRPEKGTRHHYRQLWATSGRAASARNLWAISPASVTYLWIVSDNRRQYTNTRLFVKRTHESKTTVMLNLSSCTRHGPKLWLWDLTRICDLLTRLPGFYAQARDLKGHIL